ncbi:TRAM domain-containing protein [Candidatus Woesearchaeota archaeon]|nr:MAG: TRAM domain-containing protein [Candidatus Woesearchaeota archaeon]
MYGDNRSGGFRPRRGGGMGGGMGMSTAPVRVGEELDVTIEAVGEKGDGVAKKNGFVLFVPGVKAGQQVRIRVTKVLRKVGFAEVVQGGGAAAEESESSDDSGMEESSEDAPMEESSEDAPMDESSGDSEDFGEDDQQ